MSSKNKPQKRAKPAKARQHPAQRVTDTLPAPVIEHFKELQQAEKVSLEEMLMTFLLGPMAQLAIDMGEDGVEDRLLDLLHIYWNWSEKLDVKSSLQRANTPEFMTAMANASVRVQEEMDAELALIEEHFQALKEAESISQEEMIKVFLEGPLVPGGDDPDDDLDDEDFAAELASVFIDYWEWSEGLDEDAANIRLASTQFENDLENAFKRIKAEYEEARALFH